MRETHMRPILHSLIGSAAGSENGPQIAARALLALACLISGLARPALAATIYVTTLTDKVSSTGGCSLKEAIYSSTLHDTLDGVHGIAIDFTDPDHFIITECEIGSGNDTIILPTGYPLPVFQLIMDTSWDAHNPYGPTATPIINSNITIQGYGATLQWAGTGHVRLFAVGPATIITPNGVSSATGSLTLINVHIKGFQAKGGDGADGGGGGLGAGGAIYIRSGNLNIKDSAFDGNVATGGAGGSPAGETGSGAGGGGGGLGGNGGAATELSGGGGGGSRGNGGNALGGGGGGGGTVNNGDSTPLTTGLGGPGGYLCGGDGGGESGDGNSGDNARCSGGGGGGGGDATTPTFFTSSAGGSGFYGGGGGGGAYTDHGGNGGFGGGGGGAGTMVGIAGSGGNGGFGSGGGAGYFNIFTNPGGGPGQGGAFGANADIIGGGGGAALGGAIFSDNAVVVIENSTFANNSLFDGLGGNEGNGFRADNGGAAGAIFARDGSVTIIDSTISGNQADGSGAGLVVYSDSSASLTLNDTIIAGNGANECYVRGNVTVTGAGNLIMSNGTSASFNPCPGVVATGDPQLGPLQLNSPGITPTMGISTTSTAFNAADPDTSLSTDQRGVDRPQDGGFDIGAYEACTPPRIPNEITCVTLVNAPPPNTVPLTVQILPSGGGTTSPPAGTTQEVVGSVVIATATPNPGYYFYTWSGDVPFNDTDHVTGLVMNLPTAIEARFLPCGCATDVTNSVTVTRGPIVLNPVTKAYAETVTVKNNSGKTLTGPISLVLQNLSSTALLVNQVSTTTFATPLGSPYVSNNVNLAPGQSVSFALEFGDTGNAPISYTTRVLAGPGAR